MHESAEALHESPKTDGGQRLELVAAGAYAAPQGKDYPPHQHTVWEIVYYREGNIRCPIGDAVYIGQPGTLLATPPGTVHAEIARTAYANFFIQIAAPMETPWPILAYDDGAGTFAHLCGALVREMRERAPDRDALTALLLAQLDIPLRRQAFPLPEGS